MHRSVVLDNDIYLKQGALWPFKAYILILHCSTY